MAFLRTEVYVTPYNYIVFSYKGFWPILNRKKFKEKIAFIAFEEMNKIKEEKNITTIEIGIVELYDIGFNTRKRFKLYGENMNFRIGRDTNAVINDIAFKSKYNRKIQLEFNFGG